VVVIRLRDRDREIIKAVNDCRVLQTRHIQELFFGSPSPAYGRLKLLYENGYLQRHYISQVATAPAASMIVYTITALGAEVLAATYDYTSDDFHLATKQLLNVGKLPHLLAVNDVRVAITRAAKQAGLRPVEWIDEFAFRAQPDYVNVKVSGGRQRRKPVYPDGYFSLKVPQGDVRCFVEVDRGTEGLSQFKSQIEIYQEYMLSGRYTERFQTKSLRILIVSTSSQRRLDSLKKAVAQAGGSSRYWFLVFKVPFAGNLLTDAVWQRLDRPQLHKLLPAG
jgi:hypothetical protein